MWTHETGRWEKVPDPEDEPGLVLYQQYQSLIKAGFTKKQAWKIFIEIVKN